MCYPGCTPSYGCSESHTFSVYDFPASWHYWVVGWGGGWEDAWICPVCCQCVYILACIHIYIYMYVLHLFMRVLLQCDQYSYKWWHFEWSCSCLFEGVSLTHVILAPGACGRGGPNSSCRRHFGMIRWLCWDRWRVPKSSVWSNTPSLFAKVVLSRDVFAYVFDPIQWITFVM